jgi:membrane protease YdiL (CAAX protease family)
MSIVFLFTFCMGLLLAFSYVKTFSILIPFAIHIGWNLTEEHSSAVHIQSLYPAVGIVLVISSKLQLLFINLASVPGRQLVNPPTAVILER